MGMDVFLLNLSQIYSDYNRENPLAKRHLTWQLWEQSLFLHIG